MVVVVVVGYWEKRGERRGGGKRQGLIVCGCCRRSHFRCFIICTNVHGPFSDHGALFLRVSP